MSYVNVTPVRGRPGHALVEIGYALSIDRLNFTLQRVGADKRYLGADGSWRADPEPLEPDRVERYEARTVLSFGPRIVNFLSDDERVRLEILSTGFSANFVWPGVAPSTGRIGSQLFPRSETPAPPQPPLAQAEPNPDTAALAPAPAPEVMPAAAPPRRNPLPWILGTLVLLLFVAGASWHYRAEIMALVSPSKPVAENQDDLVRLKAELAELLRAGDGDVGRIFDGGRRLIDSASPDLRDFGFRAIDAAAARGFASAQLEMGRLYDPRRQRRADVGTPNASIAAEWYSRSKAGGSAEAAAELRSLCEHLGQAVPGIEEALRQSILAQYCN